LFLLTSNPSEVVMIPDKNRLLFRTLGDGIFSLYVYAGPTYKDVIRQHYQTIGLSALPTYSALGFQIGMVGSGIKAGDIVRQIDNANSIIIAPFDGIWLGTTEYLIEESFKIDQNRFPQDQLDKIASMKSNI
jgi:alpha-glucosidase (family GH31 glycosyl hydrolase)